MKYHIIVSRDPPVQVGNYDISQHSLQRIKLKGYSRYFGSSPSLSLQNEI